MSADDDLAIPRWRYLNDPQFHALVTEIVVQKHRETLDALKVMSRAASKAAERAEHWENAYWNLLDHAGRCNCDTAPVGVGCPVHPEESSP